MTDQTKTKDVRDIADLIWEMARTEHAKGNQKLATILKQVSTDLHYLATNDGDSWAIT